MIDTKLKSRIVDYIKSVEERGGNCPSVRNIAISVGSSKSTVQRYLTALEKSGELTAGEFGYTACGAHEAAVSVPVLGGIPCGALDERYEDVEGYIKLPVSMLGGGSHYFLRADGDSMVGAGIESGDLVLIRQQEYAERGDIVVARVEGEVTLKRFYPEPEKRIIRLVAENDKYNDILVRDCMIQGVAVMALKDLRKK